jgi:hypothetical protein
VRAKHVGPEPWETAVWTIHDRLAEARQKQGKLAAQQLAEKALQAIVAPLKATIKHEQLDDAQRPRAVS